MAWTRPAPAACSTLCHPLSTQPRRSPQSRERRMRRLMLLRHAKSDWPVGVADLERPLAPRGRAEAPVIGSFMAREALRPHLALVSPAKRTRETWALVSAALAEPPPHKIDAALYMATAEALIAR